MRLNRKQLEALTKLAGDYGDVDVRKSGPLLRAAIYVQSASSSGTKYVYFNSEGKEVSV